MVRNVAILVALLATSSLACSETLWLPASGVGGGGGRGASAGGGSGGRDGGVGGRGGPGGSGGRGGACIGGALATIRIDRPELLISLGRNSSMDSRFGDGSRLSVTERVLRELITTHQDDVSFGYQEFPDDHCGRAVCCADDLALLPGPGTLAAIETKLRQCDATPNACASPLEARPLGAAMSDTLASLGTSEKRGRRVVLITDGDPGCAPDEPLNCPAVSMPVNELRKREVYTHVVAVGHAAGATVPCLANIAQQAGTGPAGVPPTIYPAATAEELRNSLGEIFDRAEDAACLINFVSAPPTSAQGVVVTIRDDLIPAGGPDGWSLVVASQPPQQPQLQVRGQSCRILKRVSSSDVKVYVGCIAP